MRNLSILVALLLSLSFTACKKEKPIIDEEPPIVIDDCDYSFEYVEGEVIPMSNIISTDSVIVGDVDNFINPCKPKHINPLLFTDAKRRTTTVVIEFENIYPIKDMEITAYTGDKASVLDKVSVAFSYNGYQYQKLGDYQLGKTTLIAFDNQLSKTVRLSFSGNEDYGINHIAFTLGSGYYVSFAEAYTNLFKRTSGWTGADGIYSFNLTNGNDDFDQQDITTAFIFSDTFVGEFGPKGNRVNTVMLNNSLGYLEARNFEDITFDYDQSGDKPSNPFVADYFLGSKARNLSDPQGLDYSMEKTAKLSNINNGSMWKSKKIADTELVLDFYDVITIDSLYLWNYNETPEIGLTQFKLLSSLDGINYQEVDTYNISQAPGLPANYQLEILLDVEMRYLKFEALESDSDTFVGLGKIMAFKDDVYQFFKATATHEDLEISNNEKRARLWLQDGVVIDNYFYVFPILIKDFEGLFKVFNVSMIKAPITHNRIAFEEAIYLDTPLQVEMGGAQIFYGAGVMNQSHIDGYVYIYGYKDLDGRSLTVARVKPEEIEDFSKWTYFDGEAFQKDITKSKGLLKGVSAELSVTLITEGLNAGKYMVVSMENTISGKVSYSLGDTITGPFTDWHQIYQTPEQTTSVAGTTYNAKMHPHLSKPGKYLISYNVNSNSGLELNRTDIYRPRFIWLNEIKKGE